MNLASAYPEVAKALLQELKNWRVSLNAQMPTANPQWHEKPYEFENKKREK